MGEAGEGQEAVARAALDSTVQATRNTSLKAGKAVAERTPDRVKEATGTAVGAALVPTVGNVVQLLELLNDWVIELTDPEAVLDHHREKGREVEALEDLRRLDLEELEELTDRMALKWATRRRMERQGPQDEGEQGNFVEGPVLVVEYLAIYS